MKRSTFALIFPLVLTISCASPPQQQAVVAHVTATLRVVTATPIPAEIPTAAPTETPTSLTERATISVPQGKPLAIDGTMSPGEWGSAAIETFSDGSELFLMYSEGYLYLGIRAKTPEMIVGNVFVEHGDEITILHSSAALGTARYQKGMGSWQQTQGFVWRCRNTDNSETAQLERDAFLQEEHWVAANARMGSPNELEFQIEVTNETLRLAVNFLTASNPNVKIPWPNDLNDDCIKPTPGGMPAQLHFSPDTWATIGIPSDR